MRRDSAVILAVDLGTSACKTALITANGSVLGWESEPLTLSILPDGGAEQNPADWWNAFCTTTRRLLARELVPVERIAAVCCSTQGEGTVAVDETGEALTNCLLWMDMRGAEALKRITRGLINVEGYDPLKLYRWIMLTGGAPSLSGKDPAAHMLYIRDAMPEIYARTYKFLNVLDYLNMRLTGRFVATPDSILTSWVTDNRDSANVRYHDELVRGCGIDAAKFPEIVRCDAVIGEVLSDVAAELGLPSGVKVVAGAIDVTAAAIGSGAVEDYAAHLCIGTSSWIAAHVPFKKTDISTSMASVPCAIAGKYLMITMQTTAGGNLTYLRDKILYHEDELLRESAQPDLFKLLDCIAARVPAGSGGLIYTPWLHGERSPVEDRYVRGGLFNLSLEHSREHIIRAFFEGVALNTRWMLKPAEAFLGRKIEVLNIVGGGASSAVWCQIMADVLGVTIRRVCDPIQVNARGAAGIAAVGLGLISYGEFAAQTQYSGVYEPDSGNRVVYDRRFGEFVSIYQAMKGIYRRMNG